MRKFDNVANKLQLGLFEADDIYDHSESHEPERFQRKQWLRDREKKVCDLRCGASRSYIETDLAPGNCTAFFWMVCSEHENIITGLERTIRC